MKSGWFKFWRKIIEGDTWKSLPGNDSRVVLITLLCWTKFQDEEITCKTCGRKHQLLEGDCFFTYESLGIASKTSRYIATKTVERAITSGFLRENSRCTCDKLTIVSVCNWALYQGKDDGANAELTLDSHQTNAELTLDSHKTKNIRSKEVKKNYVETFSEEAIRLTNMWMEKHPPPDSDKIKFAKKWPKEFEDLHAMDKHDWVEIEQVVTYVLSDKKEISNGSNWRGWFSVCRTPSKLRKRNKDDLKYFDVILDQIKNNKSKAQGEKLNYFD